MSKTNKRYRAYVWAFMATTLLCYIWTVASIIYVAVRLVQHFING